MVWYLANRVESLGVVTIGVLRIPLGHADGVASSELILPSEQCMQRTSPLEGSRSALGEITAMTSVGS